MTDDKVAVIIVTYNGIKWIKKNIESVLSGSIPSSIIVIDNNSSDETVEFIRFNYPSVKIIGLTKNLGFGAANNIGISHALKNGVDYVFLLNQDAYLDRDCIENLIEIEREYLNYGVISPIHLNGTGTRLDRNFSQYVSYSANQDFYSDFILKKSLRKIYEVPFVNAAGWLISRNCLLNVGGFDPLFFHYGEDNNYCQRLKYHGFRIGVATNSVLMHDREGRDLKVDSYEANKDMFKIKEWTLKIKYANINTESHVEMKKRIENCNKYLIKSIIKLNFNSIKIHWMEAKLLKRIKAEIELSRSLNKKKGPNYLNLND